MFCPLKSDLNPKSLCDSYAKTGTYLQIITVCPRMHSTLSKKYKIHESEICYPMVTVLFSCHDQKTGLRETVIHSNKYVMLMAVLTKQNLSISITFMASHRANALRSASTIGLIPKNEKDFDSAISEFSQHFFLKVSAIYSSANTPGHMHSSNRLGT